MVKLERVIALHAASLDDPSVHSPTMDIFTESAHAWGPYDAKSCREASRARIIDRVFTVLCTCGSIRNGGRGFCLTMGAHQRFGQWPGRQPDYLALSVRHQHNLAEHPAPCQHLVRASRFIERQPLRDQGFDLALFEQVQEC
jgi:hypothetical protein